MNVSGFYVETSYYGVSVYGVSVYVVSVYVVSVYDVSWSQSLPKCQRGGVGDCVPGVSDFWHRICINYRRLKFDSNQT